MSTSETGDYATPFAVCNQHVFIKINTIAAGGGGDVVLTGARVDENTGVTTPGATEIITVDESETQYYQSNGKYWEVTTIDASALVGANYDIGVVGYLDLGNNDFRVERLRVDATANGVNPSFAVRLRKIQDDGDKKMSLVDIEHIGVDANAVGNQIVDHVRPNRSYSPVVSAIWADGFALDFKQEDYSDYFTNNENIMESSQKDEGITLEILGEGGSLSNVEHVQIQLFYILI